MFDDCFLLLLFLLFSGFFLNCEKPRNKSQSWPPNKQLFVVKNILEARRSKVKSTVIISTWKKFQFSSWRELDKVGNTDIKVCLP